MLKGIIFTETALLLPDQEIPYEDIFYRKTDVLKVEARTIELPDREEPVGFTALYGLFRQTAPELGCLIGDDVRGRGVGRWAERLTVTKAFEDFGAHRIYGRIPAFNEAAKKVVTAQGWSLEGTMPGHIKRDGELIDCEIWGASPEEFFAAVAKW